MTRLPDEDLTVLVDRAAQGLATSKGRDWDNMPGGEKNVIREWCLPIIYHGTQALAELGYWKPRLVSDHAEIDSLPSGTVVRSRDDIRYVHLSAHSGAKRMLWWPVEHDRHNHFHTSGEIMPVTVLLDPEETTDA